MSGRRVKSLRFLRYYRRRNTGLVKSATEYAQSQRASTHKGRIVWQQAFLESVALESDTAANQVEAEASVWEAVQHADHGMELRLYLLSSVSNVRVRSTQYLVPFSSSGTMFSSPYTFSSP
jgi:hypothetical protein